VPTERVTCTRVAEIIPVAQFTQNERMNQDGDPIERGLSCLLCICYKFPKTDVVCLHT